MQPCKLQCYSTKVHCCLSVNSQSQSQDYCYVPTHRFSECCGIWLYLHTKMQVLQTAALRNAFRKFFQAATWYEMSEQLLAQLQKLWMQKNHAIMTIINFRQVHDFGMAISRIYRVVQRKRGHSTFSKISRKLLKISQWFFAHIKASVCLTCL